MKEETKIKKMNSEMIISTEIEKAFALPHNLSPIHKKILSQSINSEGQLNEMEASHCSIKTPTFIDIPPKQQFSISNNIFSTHQCKNQIHQRRYLAYDDKRKQVICLRCNEEGLIDNDLKKLNESCDETIDEVSNRCMTYNCLGYPCFVCVDCSDYICFNCFTNQHENHKTSSVPFMANSFRDEVNKMYNELKDCVEQLNQLTIEKPKKKTHHSINNNSNSTNSNEQLTQLLNLIPIAKKNILSSINDSNENAYQEYCKSFESNDKESNDVHLLFSTIKRQYRDIEDSLNKLCNNLDDPLIKNESKCGMRKSENETITKGQCLLKSSTNGLNRLTQLEYNTHKNNSSMASKQTTLIKSLQAVEESILFSIKSGSSNNAIHLNRFQSFLHNSMIYYKTTSVIIKSTQTIHLTGLNMCGLYIHKHRLKNPNNNLHRIENRDSVDINVSLLKVKKGSDNTIVMINERKKLYGAVNPNDPIISLYFSNGVLIEKESEYLITIDNLNTVSYYGDFWSGSGFSKTHSVRHQNLICNSTGIEIEFSPPSGVQSDFDEFSNGLIEGIIFTTD